MKKIFVFPVVSFLVLTAFSGPSRPSLLSLPESRCDEIVIVCQSPEERMINTYNEKYSSIVSLLQTRNYFYLLHEITALFLLVEQIQITKLREELSAQLFCLRKSVVSCLNQLTYEQKIAMAEIDSELIFNIYGGDLHQTYQAILRAYIPNTSISLRRVTHDFSFDDADVVRRRIG